MSRRGEKTEEALWCVTSVPAPICGSSLATTPSQEKVPSPTYTSKKTKPQANQTKRHKSSGPGCQRTASYRALRAVLDVVDGQFHLRLLVDVGLLEEGDAAEEDGVTGTLWTEAVS